MRTASAAAKPCQGDSLEFYLITGSIYTDQRGTVVITTIFDEGLEVDSIRRIQGTGYGVLEFLGVGTMFDIFQNLYILYLQHDVLSFSGYGVLCLFPLWSLVSAGTDTYKARLMANGSIQQLGVDCNDTFSLVVKAATIRTVQSLALSRNWPIYQLDVKNAFLNDDISETVYMYQAPGFVDVRFTHHVCRLQRRGTKVAYLLIYVDDIVLTASSTDLLQRIISSLHREFDMTNLGALDYFLGISVTREFKGMFLSQKKYALQLLDKAHMANCSPTRTLVDTESKLGSGGVPVSDQPLYLKSCRCLHNLTYSLSNISYAVQQVCLHMHDPPKPHFPLSSEFFVTFVAYWAGCPTTRRSTSGYCVFFGDNLLSWSSKRQHTLSRSSAEAEYKGVSNVVAETTWLHNLLRELHTPLFSATLVYCDNVSAIYLTANPVQHQRTKHIEIDIYFIRDMVARGQVRVLHVPYRYQYADIFTKVLPFALFEEFRTSLSVRPSPAQTAREC
ncbi:ribonuclease H-like domain-containing protein [Tanacetum coccineum]